KYPQILIKYIEQYNLNDYTLIAMGRKSRPDDMAAVQPSTSPEAKGNKNSPFLDNISISTTSSPTSAEPPVASSEKTVAAVYPESEFKINNTRVVYVKAGTSLLSIAEKYDVKYSFLLDF